MREAAAFDVLVVDDEPLLRNLLKLALERAGYRVATVNDGQAAADFLLSQSGVRLVLLDLMMPVMDGMRFLAWLHEQPGVGAATRVIVVSALDPVDAAKRSERHFAGVAAFVTKPVRVPDLLRVVKRVLQGDD